LPLAACCGAAFYRAAPQGIVREMVLWLLDGR
jgi:hypothetical protein